MAAPSVVLVAVAVVGDLGFLRRQVGSSRNLGDSAPVRFLYGGQDGEIEHHLFPSMPRANLPWARVVRTFRAEHAVPYAGQSRRHTYGDVVAHLRTVGGGVGSVD